MFILEADFSANQDIEKIQEYITEMRSAKKFDKSLAYKLSGAIAKCFNFKEVDLTIMKDDSKMVAYTYTNKIHKFPVIVNQDGFRWGDAKNMWPYLEIYISSGMFFSDKLSDREVTAVILHEIGHHFDVSVNNLYNIRTMPEKDTTLMDIMNLRKVIQKSKSKKESVTICNAALTAAEKGNPDIIAVLLNCLKYIGDKFANTVSNINPISNFIGYTIMSDSPSEEFADEFVASYGYRDDLTSALEKITTIEPNPVVSINGKLNYILNVLGGIILFGPQLATMVYFNDPYKRIYQMVDNLNTEIKECNLSAQQKSEYKKQLKEIEKVIDRAAKSQVNNIKEDPLNAGIYTFRIFALSNIGRTALGNDAYKVINGLDQLSKSKYLDDKFNSLEDKK